MSTIIIILSVLVAILLILVVLIQNSKGGGLAAGTTANQVMGVQKTADFLEKLTWGLATTLLVLALVSKMFYGTTSTVEGTDSELKEQAAETGNVAPIQTAPTTSKPVDSTKK